MSSYDQYPPGLYAFEGLPLAITCANPLAEFGQHYDVCLSGLVCTEHKRTVYYCSETGTLWCDGLDADTDWCPHALDVHSIEEMP